MSRSAKSPPKLEVYRIPFDATNGEFPSKDAVGAKAYNLMRMAACGLDVPPGFVLGTGVCKAYLERGLDGLAGLDEVVDQELQALGDRTGRRFGDPRRPLLVSVRSGAPISMPGMMETILNIGLNTSTLHGLLRQTGNPRLAADCRRRLIEQYAEVVHGIDPGVFEEILARHLGRHALLQIEDFDTEALTNLADEYEERFESTSGATFPVSPKAQLRGAIEAVLKSWMGDRAESYRKLNGISAGIGTAALVQMMVFGNAGQTSGSGVGFTRNPSDGSNMLYVDFLPNAQGEDVVAGRRNALGMDELKLRAPEAYEKLLLARLSLEKEFGDMQDFEFTVESGRLYMLQARSGKRTPLAALQIARDLVAEKVIHPEAASDLIKNLDLSTIEATELVLPVGAKPIDRGVPASAGVAVGAAVFDVSRVAQVKTKSTSIILVRRNAETNDIEALSQSDALITARGARTSHAAVVARQLGKPAIVGCRHLEIDAAEMSASLGPVTIREGDVISVDGSSGRVYSGEMPIARVKPQALIDEIQRWARPSKNEKKSRLSPTS